MEAAHCMPPLLQTALYGEAAVLAKKKKLSLVGDDITTNRTWRGNGTQGSPAAISCESSAAGFSGTWPKEGIRT